MWVLSCTALCLGPRESGPDWSVRCSLCPFSEAGPRGRSLESPSRGLKSLHKIPRLGWQAARARRRDLLRLPILLHDADLDCLHRRPIIVDLPKQRLECQIPIVLHLVVSKNHTFLYTGSRFLMWHTKGGSPLTLLLPGRFGKRAFLNHR